MKQRASQDDFVQLVSISIAADNLGKQTKFYEETLGMSFAFSLNEERESFHTVISAGVQLVIDKMQQRQEKAVMFHFAVGNLGKFKEKVANAGGKVITEDLPLPISDKVFKLMAEQHTGLRSTNSMGKFAIIRDTEGNAFGAIELEDWAQYLFTPGNISMVEADNHKAGIKTGERLLELMK